MKNTLTLLLLLTAYNTAFSQSDQWISWQTHNNVDDIAFDCTYTWITTSSSIIAYNNDTGEQVFFSESNSGISGSINAIEVDEDGNKWISSTTGLFFLKNNIIKRIESDVIDTALAHTYFLYNLKIDGKGNIWFSNANNTIYKYNPTTNNCDVFTLPVSSNKIQLAINDVGNVYALVTSNIFGYFIYTLNENITKVATFEQLPFNAIYPSSFVIDSENNYWIVIPAEVSYGKDDMQILTGGIIVYNSAGWYKFDVQEIQSVEDITGYQSAFKLLSGNIILQDQIAISAVAPNHTYYARFDKLNQTLNFELFLDTINRYTIEGVDLENNIYYQHWDLIKLNASGEQSSIPLYQIDQALSSDIYIGINNAFWIYEMGNLGLLQSGHFTNYNDKITGYTVNRLLNVLCDSINTWFIFPELIVKFDGVTWQYYSLAAFGLDTLVSEIEFVQMDKQNNFWLLGNNSLLKQNGGSWDVMHVFNESELYFYDFIIADTTAYIIGIDSMFVYDQNTWQSKFWGEDGLPEMDGNVKCVAKENGSMFLSTNDTIYSCSGIDVNVFLDVKTRVLTYSQQTQTLSWMLGDTLYQLDQFSVLSSWPVIYNDYFQTIGTDDLGNILILSEFYDPILMFNPDGLIGYPDVILNTVDIPLANCGYYINEMQGLEIKVFPNPATTYIDVYFSLLNSDDINISIYGITGQLMASENKSSVDKGVVQLNYDVSSFTPGVYFIQVNANNQTSSLSFIRL